VIYIIDQYKCYIKEQFEKGNLDKASTGYKEWKKGRLKDGNY
jgi:hypothetical protein